MSSANKNQKQRDEVSREAASSVRVRVRSVPIPVIRDIAVIGIAAPLTRDTLGVMLGFMTPEIFHGVDLRDDIIKSILARKAIVQKLGWDLIRRVVLREVKPLMTKSEILALHLEIEMTVGEAWTPKPLKP